MSKYGDPLHPEEAVEKYRNCPGNYILHFNDRTIYCGRQNTTSNRIGVHAREHSSELYAIQFMRDHRDDECLRAERERNTISQRREQGYSLRNQINASHPSQCGIRRYQ